MIKFPQFLEISKINENVYRFILNENNTSIMLKRNYSKLFTFSLKKYLLNKRFLIESNFYIETSSFKLNFIPELKKHFENYYIITEWINEIHNTAGRDEFLKNYRVFQNIELKQTKKHISIFSNTSITILRYILVGKISLSVKVSILSILTKANMLVKGNSKVLVHNNIFDYKNIIRSEIWYLIDFESIRYDKFSEIDLTNFYLDLNQWKLPDHKKINNSNVQSEIAVIRKLLLKKDSFIYKL